MLGKHVCESTAGSNPAFSASRHPDHQDAFFFGYPMGSVIIYLLFTIPVEQWFRDHYQFSYARNYQIAQFEEKIDEAALKKATLSRILDRYILYLEGQKGGFFSQSQYQKKLYQLKDQYHTDTVATVALRAQKGGDLIRNDLYIDTVIELFLEQKLFKGITITQEALKEYHQKHYARFYQEPTIELYQIVVASPMLWDKVFSELKKGNFCPLAKKYSISPEGDRCGFLGRVKKGDLPDLFNPAFKLKTGKISKMVSSESGYHLFWVKSRQKGYYPSFKEVKKRIYRDLLEQKQEARLTQFIQKKREKIDLDQLLKIVTGE